MDIKWPSGNVVTQQDFDDLNHHFEAAEKQAAERYDEVERLKFGIEEAEECKNEYANGCVDMQQQRDTCKAKLEAVRAVMFEPHNCCSKCHSSEADIIESKIYEILNPDGKKP